MTKLSPTRVQKAAGYLAGIDLLLLGAISTRWAWLDFHPATTTTGCTPENNAICVFDNRGFQAMEQFLLLIAGGGMAAWLVLVGAVWLLARQWADEVRPQETAQ